MCTDPHATRSRALPRLLAAAFLLTLSFTPAREARAGAVVPLPAVAVQEDTVEALLEEIVTRGDSGEVDPIQKLANKKTPKALDALLEAYGKLNSVYMRRAVLQGVSLYDTVDGVEQRALQALADAATQSTDRELRLAAVDLIGRCRNFGRPFLRILVESHADDEVREEALRRHVGRATEDDMIWYRELYTGRRADADDDKPRRRRGKDKDAEPEEKPPPLLPVLREVAFEPLAGTMDPDELYRSATVDPDPDIRVRAIQELDSRGEEKAEDLIEGLFESAQTKPEDRLFAAKSLLRDRGADFAADLIKEATRKAQSEAFALGIAELLDELDDEKTDAKILKKVGKGKGLEKLFWLHAARGLESEKLDKALIKLTGDKDARVARTAMSYVAARRLFDASEDLQKLAAKTKDVEILTEVLETLAVLRRGDPEWEAELVTYTQDESRSVRNAALRALATTNNPKFVETLIGALASEDWSTRLAAVRGLREMRRVEGVGPLIRQLARESGRMSFEVADALFELTGKPFRTNAVLWEGWWKDAEADFEVVKESELRKLAKEEEERRLRQVTRTEFFGVKVQSDRVIFVLDVSGSMLESTRTRYENEAGKPRIDVAKRELTRVLDSIDQRSFFNVIVFSNGVDTWEDGITAYGEETILDAKEYVSRLGAGGGTNLYGALEVAFEDPEVDTIYVLSDGEPTVGQVIDPGAIRARVADWNANRGIVVHTIAVGGSLKVLEWLAQDTGGTHVRFP